MVQTGIKLIDRYVKYFAGHLRKRGFEFEDDDLVGELSLTYAKCLDFFNSEFDSNACFKTYTVSAFRKRIIQYQREIIAKNSYSLTDDQGKDFELADESEDTLEKILCNDLKREIFKRIKNGRTLIIFNELVNTSERVEEIMNLLASHYNELPSSKHGFKGSGIFRKAVELVYGYNSESIRHHIEQAKIIAKMVLTG